MTSTDALGGGEEKCLARRRIREKEVKDAMGGGGERVGR